ncbi:MAG: hypothetical protein MZV63_50140 [Marinilabiliales bacterium]|nr:hypothetical protein [Marinilabiliales bacterium]
MDILLQFLIESIMLSVFGGIAGIVLGFAASQLVEALTLMADKRDVEFGYTLICQCAPLSVFSLDGTRREGQLSWTRLMHSDMSDY